MSHELLYRGKEIDIEKTFGCVVIHGILDGRQQKIYVSDLSDLQVLHSVVDDLLTNEYAKMQIPVPLDYDLEGC